MSDPSPKCPDCDDVATASTKEQTFPYGAENPVNLAARVLVWTCRGCGFAWTSGDAEDAREAAVAAHLAGPATGAR